MKNNIIKLLTCTLVIGFLLSCDINPCPSAEKMQSSMDELVLAAEKKALKDSSTNWNSLDSRFEKLISECYDLFKSELTISDKKAFWLNGIRYYKHRYGKNWYEKLDDPNDPLAMRIEEEIGDAFESSAENVLEFIKEVYGDDLKAGIDEVVKEIEKLGEELKNILSN